MIDHTLLGIMVTVFALLLIGLLLEAHAKQQERRASMKLLKSRKMLDYEIDRGVRAMQEANRTKTNGAKAQKTGGSNV